MIRIGSKFEKTKAKLRHGIWRREIDALEAEAENHECYFCRGRIEGKMQILTVEEKDWDDHFYVGIGCYERAKFFADYYEISSSLN